MRSMLKVLPVLSAFAVLTAVSAGQAAVSCRAVEATILLHTTKDGCTSPVGLCAKGMVESSDPALAGATWFFTAQGTSEAAGLPALLPASMLSYAGSVVITTPQDGTVTTSNAGMFDTAAGAFSQLDLVTGGTGKFAGTEGRRLFTTATGAGDGRFNSHVRGELCLNP